VSTVVPLTSPPLVSTESKLTVIGEVVSNILKTLLELTPTTKTLPDESVATPPVLTSVFPAPSPVPSMISVMTPPGVILKALLEGEAPVTKTLPDESVATPFVASSVFPSPSPVPSMISVMTPPGVILKTLSE